MIGLFYDSSFKKRHRLVFTFNNLLIKIAVMMKGVLHFVVRVVFYIVSEDDAEAFYNKETRIEIIFVK